ncbi:hypothetical protein R3P38DRAFT_2819805 [Favolaschia claudopus]|uniref:SET domain-containing protein n=1 Tax=Favolaschia claudopus TaxID=2862362 RepID=A0AAW0EDF5_9AGAR
MRSRNLLSVCLAGACMAQEALSVDNVQVSLGGICQSPTHASFPGMSVCLSENITLVSQYENDTTRIPIPQDAKQAVSDTLDWTFKKPCYLAGTTEFCVFSSPTFAQGRGMSLVTTAKRAAAILALPSFHDPELVRGANQDLEPDRPHVYHVVEVPGKGLGVVAAKPLYRGDHIISNTVSLIIDYGAHEQMPQVELNKLMAAGIEYLPERHRDRMLNLSTHNDADAYLEKVQKLVATNCFDLEPIDDSPHAMQAVFPEISRLNHDCRPNAEYYFDYKTFTHHIHAIKPIAQGEEITISYIDPVETHQARVDRVKNWGFECSCSLCSAEAHIRNASDARVRQINELRDEFEDYTTKSRATPQMGDLMVSLHEQERLIASLYSAYTYAAIEWNGVGEPWVATKYANLAVEYGLPSVGPTDPDVKEMQKLLSDPWGHWSWMLRTKKRMSWGKDGKEVDGKKKEGEDDEED